MIRKDDLIMEKKKDFTIEELTKQCEEAKKNFETLNKELNKALKEEEDRKKAQLALEKESRKEEINEAFDKYNKLLRAYIQDYGSYSTITNGQGSIFLDKYWPSFF
jgi:small-conductance mechanosensitive channel